MPIESYAATSIDHTWAGVPWTVTVVREMVGFVLRSIELFTPTTRVVGGTMPPSVTVGVSDDGVDAQAVSAAIDSVESRARWRMSPPERRSSGEWYPRMSSIRIPRQRDVSKRARIA